MKHLLFVLCLAGCLTAAAQEAKTDEKGRPYFEIDGDVMTRYYLVLLKSGPNRNQSKEEADSIQAGHLAHIGKMAEAGVLQVAGPMGDNTALRGIFIFAVAEEEEVTEWVNRDPAVKSGRLVAEIHPWWAARGTCLD